MTKTFPKISPPDQLLDDATTISDDDFARNPFVLQMEIRDCFGRTTVIRRGTAEEVECFRKGVYGSCSWYPIENGTVTVVEQHLSYKESKELLKEVKGRLEQHGHRVRIRNGFDD